jgi:thiol-disulfide isomerase/thioredoxin
MSKMYRISLFIILVYIFTPGCDSVKTATINGSLENISDKSISISIGSDPRTLLKTKENAISCEINEDGSFSFSVDFEAPIWITMISDEYQFISGLVLINGGETQIYSDCNRMLETLEYSGANGSVNRFYRMWDKLYNGVLRDIRNNDLEYEEWISRLDSIELVGFDMLDEFDSEKGLTKNELRWLSSNIKYRKYSSLVRRAFRKESKPEDPDFDFFAELDLNDEAACMINRNYNLLINDYILNQVNSQGVFWDPAGDNTHFMELMYITALHKLSGKVRDVMLNCRVSDLISSNDIKAPSYYERFMKDCKTRELREMTSDLYDDYLALAAKEMGPNVEILQTDNFAPMEVLSRFENKILYLDFWASWCSPCISSIPKTMELAQHYFKKDVEVVFVGNSDQELNLKSAIKKYEITGKHIILNQDESEIWKDEFDVAGIPSYVLLDRNNVVVDISCAGSRQPFDIYYD